MRMTEKSALCLQYNFYHMLQVGEKTDLSVGSVAGYIANIHSNEAATGNPAVDHHPSKRSALGSIRHRCTRSSRPPTAVWWIGSVWHWHICSSRWPTSGWWIGSMPVSRQRHVSLCIQQQTGNKLATILLPATCCLLPAAAGQYVALVLVYKRGWKQALLSIGNRNTASAHQLSTTRQRCRSVTVSIFPNAQQFS